MANQGQDDARRKEKPVLAIGFLVPLVKIPLPPLAIGALVGLLISLPDAVITKAYAPILLSGVIGGAIISWATGRFVA